jgi:hypothetical protein
MNTVIVRLNDDWFVLFVAFVEKQDAALVRSFSC